MKLVKTRIVGLWSLSLACLPMVDSTSDDLSAARRGPRRPPAESLSKLAPSKLPLQFPPVEGDPVPMVGWTRFDGARELSQGFESGALLMDFYPLPSRSAISALSELNQSVRRLADAGVEVRAFSSLSQDEHAHMVRTSTYAFPLVTPSPELIRAFSIVTESGRTTRQAFLIYKGRIQKVWRLGMHNYIDEALVLIDALSKDDLK
ncbi:MAG: peroxiredoxin family protein [Myxococcales bacterium]|nr:peroxiredoxin family protein [Myxococcales bacterium]